MDYQNRIGSKKGGGGVASASESNAYRRERIKKLVTNTIDIDNDPYVFKNHVGLLECRLCLTTHTTPESFLSHAQGRKHQLNLQKRSYLEAKSQDNNNNNNNNNQGTKFGISSIHPKRSKAETIGKPGYKVVKIRDPVSLELGLLINIKYPNITKGEKPCYRFMSSFEQNVDLQKDANYQYLVISGDPYENIAFKIPSKEIYRNEEDDINNDSKNNNNNNDDNNDNDANKFWTFWDEDTNEFYIQFFYKNLT